MFLQQLALHIAGILTTQNTFPLPLSLSPDGYAQNPQNASCAINGTAHFNCTVTGTESELIVWKKQCPSMADYEEVLLSDNRYHITSTSIEGNQYRASLQIRRCSPEDNNCNFICVASGNIISHPAVVKIEESKNIPTTCK